MGTESETEEQEEQEEEEQSNSDTEESKLLKDLRKQIRDANKELKTLRPLKETNAFLSANLGELSEEKRTALRAVVGEDMSADNLLAKARLLGFVAEDSKTKDEQQTIDNERKTISQTEKVVSSRTATPDNRDFITKLNEAKTQDETMAIIAAEGQEHGLLVEEY